MRKENLIAGVQYNDFTGTAAADRADQGDLVTVLEAKGLMNRETDLLVGVRLYSGDHDYLSIEALLVDRDKARDPDEVREVATGLSLAEFFATFKRFNVILTGKHFDAGKEYTIID